MSVLILCLLVFSKFTAWAEVNPEGDRYKNFADLDAHEKRGKDYKIEQIEREKSDVLSLAIHGGEIEPGTAEIARAFAKRKYSLYVFNGISKSDPENPSMTDSRLHLTSHHFDEPDLLLLAPKHKTCVSFHGYPGDEADICLGGKNEVLRLKMLQTLELAFPGLKTCSLCCSPYNGLHKKNPVNLCSNTGVQLEMSPKVRKMILKSWKFRRNFQKVLRISLKRRSIQ